MLLLGDDVVLDALFDRDELLVRRTTSMRFTEDEFELIDAAKVALTSTRGIPHSRADVFRTVLRKLVPPDGAAPELAAWRRAYTTVFPKAPEQ